MEYNFIGLVFCFVLIYMIIQFIFILNVGKDDHLMENYNNKIAIQQKTDAFVKTDCDKNIRYCTNNFDCSYFCEAPVSYNVKNICDTSLNICTPSAVAPTLLCDKKKGFLDSFVQTEVDGFWKCLNTKPYFFDEQQQLYSYVCGSDGIVDYDFNNSPQLNCECSKDYIKVYNINKPNIPICIKPEKLKLLSSFVNY